MKRECSACRDALNNLPKQDPRRPVIRDPVTSEVMWLELEERHAEAYLEFEEHAKFIVSFFLDRYGVVLPSVGIKIVEQSRLDACRGGPVSVLLGGDGESAQGPPVELELYNNTGISLRGYHYEPVFVRSSVPPPPMPPRSGAQWPRPAGTL